MSPRPGFSGLISAALLFVVLPSALLAQPPSPFLRGSGARELMMKVARSSNATSNATSEARTNTTVTVDGTRISANRTISHPSNGTTTTTVSVTVSRADNAPHANATTIVALPNAEFITPAEGEGGGLVSNVLQSLNPRLPYPDVEDGSGVTGVMPDGSISRGGSRTRPGSSNGPSSSPASGAAWSQRGPTSGFGQPGNTGPNPWGSTGIGL